MFRQTFLAQSVTNNPFVLSETKVKTFSRIHIDYKKLIYSIDQDKNGELNCQFMVGLKSLSWKNEFAKYNFRKSAIE